MHCITQKLYPLLLTAFFFALPWQTVFLLRDVSVNGEKWHYATIGLYGFELLLGALLLLTAQRMCKNDLCTIIRNPLFLSAALFVAWACASIAWAADKPLALTHAAVLLLGLGLFFLLYKPPVARRTLITAFVLAVTLHATIAIGQFITQDTFSSTFFGMSVHPVATPGTSIVTTDTGRWLRAYGGFAHPNVLGGFAAVALLFVIDSYRTAQERSVREKMFLLISSAILFTALLVTFSRSAWLAFCIGLLTLTFFALYRHKTEHLTAIAKHVFLFLCIGIIMLSMYFSIFFTRVTHDSAAAHNSHVDRATYVLQSRTIIQQHPLHGVGSGNYVYALYASDHKPEPIWTYQPVHNIFRLITAEIGAIGIILFLGVLVAVLYTARKNTTLHTPVLIAIFVAMITAGFFDHWPWTQPSGILLFFALLALVAKKSGSS